MTFENPYTSLAGAIAIHIAGVPGIREAIYPPQAGIESAQTPIAIVQLGAAEGESRIDMDMDGEKHHPFIKVQVMVPWEGSVPEEIAEVDSLIWPICKAFNAMTAVNAEPAFADIGFHVDKVQIPRWRGGLLMTYGSMMYYGAEFYFSIKFHG